MLTSFEISHNIELQIDLKIINIQSLCENQTVHKLEKLFSFHSIYPFGWKVYTRPVGKKKSKIWKIGTCCCRTDGQFRTFTRAKKKKKRRASRAREVAVTARESWRLKPDVNASTRDVPMSHAPAPRGRFAISHPRVAGDEPDAVISGKKRLRSGAGATPMWPACCCCPSTGQSVQHISCHKTAWCLAVPLLLPSYCVLDEEYDY